MADMRTCIGSAKFGIEAHAAPPEEFPAQPSQRDGPGESAPAAAAPKAVGSETAKKPRAAQSEPIRTRVPRGRQEAAPEAGSQGDAE
jgi:hypothetical protein